MVLVIRIRSSGCAAIAHFPDHLGRQDERIADFGCAESSNNRMELMACIKALRWARESQPWSDVTRVQIVTGSTYITDNISYRARGWKKNKWRNRFGKPPLCPKEAKEWEAPLKKMYDHLRLNDRSELEKRVHKLFLHV
jgi:ribonuclease HI